MKNRGERIELPNQKYKQKWHHMLGFTNLYAIGIELMIEKAMRCQFHGLLHEAATRLRERMGNNKDIFGVDIKMNLNQ